MASAFSKANIIGGAFQAADGTPLSNGWLVLTLSHDSNVSTLGGPNGIQVASGLKVTLFLDTNGNLVPNQYIWTNDLLSPSGSYYTVIAYTFQGTVAWSFPQTFFIQPYSPTINIGTIQPNTP
jgi:hypothetical protein